MTRWRVAATDTTGGPAGEGFCGTDSVACPPLPFTSFGSYHVEELPNGAKSVSVQFKNWRNDLGRRGVFAVWFTPAAAPRPREAPVQPSRWWQFWRRRGSV